MKTTHLIVLAALFLCDCAQPRVSSAAGSAVDLVQAGQDLVRPDGTVIHVTKRSGSSIEGIQIVKANGPIKFTTTADTGTVQAERDSDKIRIILYHAKMQVTHIGGGVTTWTDDKLNMLF